MNSRSEQPSCNFSTILWPEKKEMDLQSSECKDNFLWLSAKEASVKVLLACFFTILRGCYLLQKFFIFASWKGKKHLPLDGYSRVCSAAY